MFEIHKLRLALLGVRAMVKGLLAATALLVLALAAVSRGRRYSWFWLMDEDSVASREDHEASRATSYLSSEHAAWNLPGTTDADVCITIATTDRTPQRYLTRNFASLLQAWENDADNDRRAVDLHGRLDPHSGHWVPWQSDSVDNTPVSFSLRVFNTMGGLKEHPELEGLTQSIPALADSVAASPFSHARGQVKFGLKTLEKETSDYALALRQCLSNASSARYVVMFEDDVQVSHDFFGRLRGLVHVLDDYPRDDWSFVKLFMEDTLHGWESSDARRLVLCGVLVGIPLSLVVVSLLEWTLRRRLGGVEYMSLTERKPSSRLCVSVRVLAVVLTVACYCVLAVLLTPLALGRQNMFRQPDGLHVTGESIMAQAHLYSRKAADDIVDVVNRGDYSRSTPNVDLLLADWSRQRHLRTLFLVPNIAQHIGRKSSLGKSQPLSRFKTSHTFVDGEGPLSGWLEV